MTMVLLLLLLSQTRTSVHGFSTRPPSRPTLDRGVVESPAPTTKTENKRQLIVALEEEDDDDRTLIDFGNERTDWDHYSIMEGDPYFLFSPDYYERRNAINREAIVEFLLPFVAPVLAFGSYDLVSNAFGAFVEFLAQNNWVAVDGGAYQAKIITPTINGIVLPAISVLFATLTSTTVITLRDRQVQIRQSINAEAGELRALEYLLSAYPNAMPLQTTCRQYMIQYTSRIIAESQPESSFLCSPVSSSWTTLFQNDLPSAQRGSMDSELNGVQRALAQATADEALPIPLLDQSFQAITRLRECRHKRLTALQSTYPPLHYAILAILASGDCTGFLIEGKQELLVFLNAVQLKILWSMLVGTFVACFAVFYDLLRPFSGCYQVNAAVDQLYTIRLGLKADAQVSLYPRQQTTPQAQPSSSSSTEP